LTAVLAAGCGGSSSNDQAAEPEAAAPVTNPVNPATAGNINGKVTFSGTAPAPQPIKMASDPNCQPDAGSPVIQTQLDGEYGAIENVFVHVKDGLGNLVFPVDMTPVVLDQRGCTYTPHVFAVMVGQPVEIRNSDPTLHNVHAMPRENREFNQGFPIKDMKMTHVFTKKEVMVPFKCDVHGWMRAYMSVLDHPFFAVTGKDGSFSLKGLPPGTYTIEAWHEKLGTQTQTVTIAEKETKDLTFTFSS
jgi:plastocyanin